MFAPPAKKNMCGQTIASFLTALRRLAGHNFSSGMHRFNAFKSRVSIQNSASVFVCDA
jgi:hypothetical protein